MKNFLLSTVGLIALRLAAHASEVDAAGGRYTKAPPIVAPIYEWSGLYIGADAGGGWSHKCWSETAVFGIPFGFGVAEGCHNATGAIAGGQIGYRWMSGPVVFGLEAQGDWANLRGSNISLLNGPALSNRSTIDALGLFTGQPGYSCNNLLW